MPYTSMKDAARDALQCQNACNLSGVAHSFLDAVKFIRESNPGLSTGEINRHPIVTLFLSKLVSLNGTDCFCSLCLDTFRKATEQVEAIAHATNNQIA